MIKLEDVTSDQIRDEKDTAKTSRLRDFLDNTSLHGVRYLNDKRLFRKVLFSCAVLAAFSVGGLQVFRSITAFYKRPFSTVITSKRVQELAFPAVTFCNLNVINKKRYARVIKMQYPERTTSNADLEAEILEIISLLSSFEDQAVENKTYLRQLVESHLYSARGPIFGNYVASYAHTIEGVMSLEWLGPCTWLGNKPCSTRNFTNFINLKMGQCFTFNPGTKGYPLLVTKLIGPSKGGLKLRLNVQEDSHVSNFFALEAGFKVLIHDQRELPTSVEEFGFAVQPGTHTFAAIRQKRIKNLPAPFKTMCASRNTPFSNYFNVSYSVFACIKQCLYDYGIAKCNCQPLFKIKDGVELCSIKDTFECIYPKFFGNLPDEVAKCANECPEPCEYTKYETKLSYASAVGNAFARSLPSSIATHGDSESFKRFQNLSVAERKEFFRENVVSLDVYYEELSYDFIEQKAVFDDWALIGTIGGYMGLFLGMSLLTILEFFDFLVTSIIDSFRRKKKLGSSVSDFKS